MANVPIEWRFERDPSPYASRSGERFSTDVRKVLQEWKTPVPSHNFKVPEGGLSEHCLIASLGAACEDAASGEQIDALAREVGLKRLPA